jgi:hypothetical protein
MIKSVTNKGPHPKPAVTTKSIFIIAETNYCQVLGFPLVIRYTAHLYTQLVTTSNYSTTVNSHTLQFTTVGTKPSQSAVPSPVVTW